MYIQNEFVRKFQQHLPGGGELDAKFSKNTSTTAVCLQIGSFRIPWTFMVFQKSHIGIYVGCSHLVNEKKNGCRNETMHFSTHVAKTRMR